MKEHRTAISLASIALLAVIGYGTTHHLSNNGLQQTDDAYVRADSVMVAPRVSGEVAEVMVDDNEQVKAGQLLAKLDDRDYLAAQAAAKANAKAAAAAIDNLNAQIQRQKAIISEAEANIRSTLASLDFAKANAQRYLNLSSAGAGTIQERQKADAELSQWRAKLDGNRAVKIAADKTMDLLISELEVAKATLEKQQADLDQANLNVSYTRIVAPMDGMVGQRTVRTGAYVSAGQQLLAVVPLQKAFVVANFRETQLDKIRINQTVDLSVDSLPSQTFKGRIESVAPATGISFSAVRPDNATGNFTKVTQRVPVKIIFEEGQANLDRLRIGMSVVATVNTDDGV